MCSFWTVFRVQFSSSLSSSLFLFILTVLSLFPHINIYRFIGKSFSILYSSKTMLLWLLSHLQNINRWPSYKRHIVIDTKYHVVKYRRKTKYEKDKSVTSCCVHNQVTSHLFLRLLLSLCATNTFYEKFRLTFLWHTSV